jgi:hypothetical protein
MGQSAAVRVAAARKKRKMKNRGMGGLHYGMRLSGYCKTGLVLGVLACGAARACQVPVFRYALERWEPGVYQLRAPAASGLALAGKEVNAEMELAPGVERLELRYPAGLRQAAEEPVWTGAATAEMVGRVMDSPARAEARKRLLEGESAVWVLVESGDAAKDEEAARVLEAGLRAAEGKLALPDGVITQEEAAAVDPARRRENADVLQSDLPLKIAFSLLRVKRDDPAEEVFLAMLTGIEPDLGEYAGEPMVFPVFGRGRALEPMIGKGIHEGNVLEAAAYLCGACSCEIKEQNPGIDLLMAADWAPAEGAPKLETVAIQPAEATVAAPEKGSAAGEGGIRWGYVAGGLGVLLLAVWLLRGRGAAAAA